MIGISSQEGTTLPHVFETYSRNLMGSPTSNVDENPPPQDAIVANEGVKIGIPGGLKIVILVV